VKWRIAGVAVLIGALLVAERWVSDLEIGGGSDAPTHGCKGAQTEPWKDVAAARSATLCLLNHQRSRHRLPRLREDRALSRAALRHSRAMVAAQYLEHVGPDGSTPHQRIVAAGYRIGAGGGSTGENLASGEERAATPAVIVDGWMRSAGHRRNILEARFLEIGIGIVPRPAKRSRPGNQGATYTTTFGGRTT
jgi:uncharacterized protein YkwD